MLHIYRDDLLREFFRLQPGVVRALLEAFHAPFYLSDGGSDERAEGDPDDGDAGDDGERAQEDALLHGGAGRFDVGVRWNGQRDGPVQIALAQPLFGIPGHVELADRLAVALQAGGFHVHASEVAEVRALVGFIVLVVFAELRVVRERFESGAFERVGLVEVVARREGYVACPVIGRAREQRPDGAAGDGALQAFELVISSGIVVDDTLERGL